MVKRFLLFIIISLYILLVLSIYGIASDKPEEEIFDAGEVEITGKYGSVTTVLPSQTVWNLSFSHQNDYSNLGNNNSAQLLEQAPGIAVRHYGGLGMPVSAGLRGSAGNQTLVLIDGLPLNSPSGASVDFSLFDASNTDAIEIVPGASGAFYGDSAIGGVINLIKKVPTENNKYLSFEYGSYGHSYFNIHLNSITHPLPYSLSLFNQKWEGNFDYKTINNTIRRRNNSHYEKRGINLQLFNNKSSKQQTKYNLMLIHGEGGSPGRAEFEDRFARKNELNLLASFNTEELLNCNANIRYGGLIQYQSLNYRSPNPPIGLPVHSKQQDLGAAFIFEYHNQNTWQARTSIRYDAASNLDWNNPQRININLGTSYNFELSPRMSITPALGISYVDDSQALLSPSVGVLYRLNNHLTAKFNYAQASRFPSFPEMYTPDDGTIVGNPNLKSEKIATIDGTIHYQTDSTNGYLSLFHSDLENSIQFLPISFFRIKAMNLPKAEIDGTELGIQHRISNSFSINSSFTWLTAKYVTGGWLPARPRFRFNSSLNYSQSKFSGNITIQNATSMPLDYSGNLKSPSYTSIDCDFNYQLNNRCAISLSGANLTNAARRDAYDFPLPGRVLKLGINFNF